MCAFLLDLEVVPVIPALRDGFGLLLSVGFLAWLRRERLASQDQHLGDGLPRWSSSQEVLEVRT